jgi:arsenate reductase
MGMEIWINPACSKCASALSLLDEAGAEYTVRRYLDDPPTPAELEAVLARLGLEPWDVARTGEPVAEELGLADWPRDAAARERWTGALCEHPALIQRPIITAADGTTVIGRTQEAVRSVLPPHTCAQPHTGA